MSLSIIIPTIGRPTLARTLNSLLGQVQPYDEVIIVHDGPIKNSTCQTLIDTHFFREDIHDANDVHDRDLDEWWCLDGKGVMYHVVQLEDGPHEDWGATARNEGLKRASCDHFLFMDDDDCYTDNALDTIRRAVYVHPNDILVFRMRYHTGHILWTDPTIRFGNISTSMFVTPREAVRKPWRSEHGHDFYFFDDVVKLNPNRSVIWNTEVISLVKPHEHAA